jgi:hypothetical protein
MKKIVFLKMDQVKGTESALLSNDTNKIMSNFLETIPLKNRGFLYFHLLQLTYSSSTTEN